MRTTSLVIAALALAGALGCSNPGNSTAFKPVDVKEAPDLLVSHAVESRANLGSLAGKGVMRIVDAANNFGLTVNADVVADQSDRLRIRGDKLAGSVQAFDVVKIRDDIGFYIPTQKTLYHGKVGDLQYFSFNFDPDEVWRQMLRADTSLLLRDWRYADSRTGRGALASVVLDEDVPEGRPRLRLAINRRSGMLESISRLDARGEPILVKTFGDYRSLARGAGKNRGTGTVYPFLMSLSWPQSKRMMELHFRNVDGDAVVLDEDYDLATSADTRYLPLTEAAMESDPLARSDAALGDAAAM